MLLWIETKLRYRDVNATLALGLFAVCRLYTSSIYLRDKNIWILQLLTPNMPTRGVIDGQTQVWLITQIMALLLVQGPWSTCVVLTSLQSSARHCPGTYKQHTYS